MNNQWLLFLVLALLAPGCGNGNGGNDDADAADVPKDQEAADETVADGDVPAEDSLEELDPEQACLDSGGTVDTMLCCLSADDFPNLCGFGACGCAPADSHEVRRCLCGAGRCFDGSSCVTR